MKQTSNCFERCLREASWNALAASIGSSRLGIRDKPSSGHQTSHFRSVPIGEMGCSNGTEADYNDMSAGLRDCIKRPAGDRSHRALIH